MRPYQPDKQTQALYLQDKLSDEEVIHYELWLADNPKELADIELELMLQAGVRKVKVRSDSYEESYSKIKVNHKPWLWLTSIACLLLSIALIKTQVFDHNLGQVDFLKVASYELSTLRSASVDPINVSKSNHALLKVEVDKPLYQQAVYSVQILHEGRAVKALEEVVAHTNQITLVIMANSLSIGNYGLSLTDSETGETQSFNFNVIE